MVSHLKNQGPIPGKAKVDLQKKFINQYNGVKPHSLVYFSDSTHLEFGPAISYGWIEKGINFDVKTNSGFSKLLALEI